MIEITIEEITVVKDGLELHDTSTGKIDHADKWNRTRIFSQIFPDGAESDINEVIRVANGGKS